MAKETPMPIEEIHTRKTIKHLEFERLLRRRTGETAQRQIPKEKAKTPVKK